jgi:hypothetical protein
VKTFLSIFQSVAGFVGKLLPIAGTAISIMEPQFAPLVSVIQNAIVTAEANNPVGTAGQAKSQSVIADFNAALAVTQQVAAIKGEKVVYDQAKLQDAINNQVSAYNAMRDLLASIQMVKA